MLTTKVMIPAYVNKKEIKGEGPNLVIMTISPEIAAFWLKTYNSSNRPLRLPHVAYLAAQMKNGQWVEMNGATISFNTDLQLNDGQHRLAAIVKSGAQFRFVVMVGVSKNAFKVADTGKNRSGSDVLAIEGYSYYSLLSSTCSFLINWNRKRIGKAAGGGKAEATTAVTNTDISEFAKMHKASLIEKCSTVSVYYKTGDRLVTPTWITALLFLFSKNNQKEAERFLFQLATGANVEHDSLMYQLRQKLRQSKESETRNIVPSAKLALIIKCWNARILKSKLKKLVYYPSRGEKFPTII